MRRLRPNLLAGLAALAGACLLAACASGAGGSATPAGRATAGATGTTIPSATPAPSVVATASGGGSATAVSATALPGRTVTPQPPGTTATPAPTPTLPPVTPTPLATPTPPATGAGVYGLITVGPTCPVERADQPCPPRAYDGTLSFQDASGHEAARVTAGSDGQYAVKLAAGTYHVVPMTTGGGMLPHGNPTDVTVTSGQWTRLDVIYDSGIR